MTCNICLTLDSQYTTFFYRNRGLLPLEHLYLFTRLKLYSTRSSNPGPPPPLRNQDLRLWPKVWPSQKEKAYLQEVNRCWPFGLIHQDSSTGGNIEEKTKIKHRAADGLPRQGHKEQAKTPGRPHHSSFCPVHDKGQMNDECT